MQSLQVPTRYSAQPKVDSARPRSSSQHQKDLETFKKTHKGADESKFSSQQKDGQLKVNISKFCPYESSLSVPLSCLKLRNAVGKRSGIRAPGNIMGMSASDVSKPLSHLGHSIAFSDHSNTTVCSCVSRLAVSQQGTRGSIPPHETFQRAIHGRGLHSSEPDIKR